MLFCLPEVVGRCIAANVVQPLIGALKGRVKFYSCTYVEEFLKYIFEILN